MLRPRQLADGAAAARTDIAALERSPVRVEGRGAGQAAILLCRAYVSVAASEVKEARSGDDWDACDAHVEPEAPLLEFLGDAA